MLGHSRFIERICPGIFANCLVPTQFLIARISVKRSSLLEKDAPRLYVSETRAPRQSGLSNETFGPSALSTTATQRGMTWFALNLDGRIKRNVDHASELQCTLLRGWPSHTDRSLERVQHCSRNDTAPVALDNRSGCLDQRRSQYRQSRQTEIQARSPRHFFLKTALLETSDSTMRSKAC